MKSVSILVISIVCLLLVVSTSCQSLALSGKEKYKVDMNNVFVNIRGELDSEGNVSDKSMKRLQSILDKYREEYGKCGSFVSAEQAQGKLLAAKTELDKSFMLNQEALGYMNDAQEYLKTEVSN